MAEEEKKADEADIAVTDEEQEEESIILVAQRYLNIFHQIHIIFLTPTVVPNLMNPSCKCPTKCALPWLICRADAYCLSMCAI